MPLDVDNPWEAHAYFVLGFYCEDCKQAFEFETSHQTCSDEWCVAIAQAAFQAGWFILPPTTDASMDFFYAWCPPCGRRRGLTQPKYARHAA